MGGRQGVIDHLDKTELRSLRIALNRLAETGAWDPDALRLEFKELTVLGVGLVVTEFETAEKRQPTVKLSPRLIVHLRAGKGSTRTGVPTSSPITETRC